MRGEISVAMVTKIIKVFIDMVAIVGVVFWLPWFFFIVGILVFYKSFRLGFGVVLCYWCAWRFGSTILRWNPGKLRDMRRGHAFWTSVFL